MLISDSRELITTDTITARNGIFQPGDTWDRKFENGRPLSRAKLQSCREAVATSLMQAEVSMSMIIKVIIVAPT
jgi:hypothetical protein